MNDQNEHHEEIIYQTPEKDIQIPGNPIREKLSIHGKTPEKLASFVVQVDPDLRSNVVIDAYAPGAYGGMGDPPTCAAALDCECELTAQELVADLHRVVVGYLTGRKTEKVKNERLIMLSLLSFAIYCKQRLRGVMLQDDFHRAMYEDMVEIVAEAKALLIPELPRIPKDQLLYAEKEGNHAEPNQEHVFMGDAQPSAPGEVDPGADPVAGDR